MDRHQCLDLLPNLVQRHIHRRIDTEMRSATEIWATLCYSLCGEGVGGQENWQVCEIHGVSPLCVQAHFAHLGDELGDPSGDFAFQTVKMALCSSSSCALHRTEGRVGTKKRLVSESVGVPSQTVAHVGCVLQRDTFFLGGGNAMPANRKKK